jgi:hypothetical protein
VRIWVFQVIHWERKCPFEAFKETKAIQMQ